MQNDVTAMLTLCSAFTSKLSASLCTLLTCDTIFHDISLKYGDINICYHEVYSTSLGTMVCAGFSLNFTTHFASVCMFVRAHTNMEVFYRIK